MNVLGSAAPQELLLHDPARGVADYDHWPGLRQKQRDRPRLGSAVSDIGRCRLDCGSLVETIMLR
jgi:hypothetical protein